MAAVERVARAVHGADVLLFINGSGNAADAGVPCGAGLCSGTMFEEICMTRPSDFYVDMAVESPEVFYGFWGRLHNLAQKAAPHEGMQRVVGNMRARVNAKKVLEDPDGAQMSNFFLYSQGIDGVMDRMVTDPAEKCSVHGSIGFWQCQQQCSEQVFRLPEGHTFSIHPATFSCKPEAFSTPADLPQGRLVSHHHDAPETAADAPHPTVDPQGYPQCPLCKARAIPNVIELGVETCNAAAFRAESFMTWRMAVEDLPLNGMTDKKVVIVEVGCSARLPTGREEAEDFTVELKQAGLDVTLVRINTEDAEVPPELGDSAVSLRMGAADALVQIDDLLKSSCFLTQAEE
eukprot:TRINITY_DN30647_c0_g1_i1.p1 TRINITY_DN30647_c0_g1~~TRINITY_DN30647_c0_g1_i1.p1  ORF type:complete len:347 (+),score=116.05 TRINITY_DN30647_c0_g1_i1:58-1098(+)